MGEALLVARVGRADAGAEEAVGALVVPLPELALGRDRLAGLPLHDALALELHPLAHLGGRELVLVEGGRQGVGDEGVEGLAWLRDVRTKLVLHELGVDAIGQQGGGGLDLVDFAWEGDGSLERRLELSPEPLDQVLVEVGHEGRRRGEVALVQGGDGLLDPGEERGEGGVGG